MAGVNQSDFPLRRRVALYLAGLGLATVVLAGYAAVHWLPVRHVRLEGTFRHVDTVALQIAVEPLVAKGYLAVDLNAIEMAVRSLPWVGEVMVVRQWPDTLAVRVEEQSPYARWRDGGFVNGEGSRFTVPETPELVALPVIAGPEGQEKALLAMLRTLNGKLAGLGRRVDVLELSIRRAWNVRLDDGLQVAMGRQDALATFDRFLMLAGLLGAERLQAVQRVDMRYPNGFAVSMKPDSGMKWGEPPPGPQGGEKELRTGATNKPKV